MRQTLRLHPAKCELYTMHVRWCGRAISMDGIRINPRRMNVLLNMQPPTTGAHQQQFLCALQWVKTATHELKKITRYIHEFTDRVCETAGKRTKLRISSFSLASIGWGEQDMKEFEACKTDLAQQTTLAHRDESSRICVYTDASYFVWPGMVT